MTNQNADFVLDAASVGTGSIGQVYGGQGLNDLSGFKNIDNNIRVKCDNQTTNNQLTNLTSASGGPANRVQDKSSMLVFTTQRGNMNQTMETQMNLQGSISTKQISYVDGAKTTTKQTTLHTWNGGATSNVPNQMTQSHYTTKDGTGGVTKEPANKDPIRDYIPGAGRVTGNMTHASRGEINFREMDNDKIRTQGSGTYSRAAPEKSRLNPVLAEHTGQVQFNPNRIQQEDRTRTDCSLVDGLLTNGFSIYNNGKKNELNYPSFMCDSRPSDYSPFKTTTIKKEEIPERDIERVIPVHNSRRNGNEIIVRNVTSDNIENPLLFTKRELIYSPSIHGKCYSGNINSSGLATDAFTKDTARYVQPPNYYFTNSSSGMFC